MTNKAIKNLKYYSLLFFITNAIIASCQCSFQYISNDTTFQDYIEFIDCPKNKDEIITIGSRINRGVINDSVFNAPVFKSFDYCGNMLTKHAYQYIGNYKLIHRPIPTHNTYKDEPIGNTAIKLKEDNYLLVDKANDTTSNALVMILFNIDGNGIIKTFKTLELNDNEANHTALKNVLELKDGKILVILWDYSFQYSFYYFDENFNFLYLNSLSLGRGIRAIKEIENGEFICTALAYDNASFQFYRLDNNGETKWIKSPYDIFGSAREIIIENNKMYITGSISFAGKGAFGILLICDLDGNILREYKYDFYCKPRFCSAYPDSDYTYFISGYVMKCDLSDSSGSDIAILRIDSSGRILWSKLFDFRNSLGTSDVLGYYNDFGGFKIAKANDGGIVTNGMTRYIRNLPGGVLYEDALLLKTEASITKNTQFNELKLDFNLAINPVSDVLNITGPLELIKIWAIYSIKGEQLFSGSTWSGQFNLDNIVSGIYAIEITDKKNVSHILKFVKI